MTTPDITAARACANTLRTLDLFGSAGMMDALATELVQLRAQVAELKDQRAEAESIAANAESRLRAQAAPTLDLMEAVDNVLTLAHCECPHSMRFDRGEHLSGCYLFDLNLAYIAAPSPAAPAQQAESTHPQDVSKSGIDTAPAAIWYSQALGDFVTADPGEPGFVRYVPAQQADRPADRCDGSLCMQTRRCSYTPCQADKEPTHD